MNITVGNSAKKQNITAARQYLKICLYYQTDWERRLAVGCEAEFRPFIRTAERIGVKRTALENPPSAIFRKWGIQLLKAVKVLKF